MEEARGRKPSPARPPGPGRTKPSQVAAGGRKPHPDPAGWQLLDRFVHRVWRHGDVKWDGTASATAHDCVGRPIRASLRVADAPAVSRLHLHWPTRPEYVGMVEPIVVAVHRHAILFYAMVPFDKDPATCRSLHFPLDYFVYSAASSPPTLTRLPPCFIGGISTPDEDIYFSPYRRRQQRIMADEEVGLLCHGADGEFTVADLTNCSYPESELCLLHHRPTARSGKETAQWRVKKLRMPSSMDLHSWTTDAVIPIGGRFLCWVDNYQGLLLADILLANDESNTDQQLYFIRLPREALQSPRVYLEDCLDPARCVCVTDTGIVKLVCITNRGTSRWDNRYAFTVTSWTMYDICRGGWCRDDTTMDHTEFFGLYDADQCLPRLPPSFPMVSLVDPDVICFLLEEDRDNFWIIQVNMRYKVLQSSALYNEVDEEEEGGCPSDIRRRNIFDGHSFFPSKFSAYFSKDAIRSREISKMMQKAKQGRLVQHRAELEAQKKAALEAKAKLK